MVSMEQVIKILSSIYKFITCNFGSVFIREDFEVYTENGRIDLKGYNAIYFKNAGEVTVFVNGSISIEPNSFYVSSNLPNQYFSEYYTITFDDSDTLGKNTGTVKRLESVIKKQQGIEQTDL